MPSSLLQPPPPEVSSTRGWGALYPVEEEIAKPRHSLIVPAAAAAKKPVAYSGGGKKRNLETCTEALGCETGGVDWCFDCVAEAEYVERKRRAMDEEEDEMVVLEGEGSACLSSSARRRGPLPPPLTTLALGTSRVRVVHERRGGRMTAYTVRAPGLLEAERSDGRLRLRHLGGAGNDDRAECRRQEAEEAETEEAKEADPEQEEECGFVKYVRGSRCVDTDGVAAAVAAVRLGTQWETEKAAAFLVATS